jgi:hypothetical protein
MKWGDCWAKELALLTWSCHSSSRNAMAADGRIADLDNMPS